MRTYHARVPAAEVLLYGTAASKATRKARRWFSERRVPVAYHDLGRRPPGVGQLRRFAERFGIEALVDTSSRTYERGGLRYLSAGDQDWLERLAADVSLLRLPLVRCGSELGVGDDPAAWQRLADAARA